MAPNILQKRVVNSLTDEVLLDEKRNVLIESARIARGKISPLEEANPKDFDAAILPGGFGAALNLSDFAISGAQCSVLPSLKNFIQDLAKDNKPVGFICIAPAVISKIYGAGVLHTIGNDIATAKLIEEMGGIHQNCSVEECVVDKKNKVVSTPAYMLADSIAQAATGINALVKEVIKLIE